MFAFLASQYNVVTCLIHLTAAGEFPVSSQRPQAGGGKLQQSHRVSQEGPLVATPSHRPLYNTSADSVRVILSISPLGGAIR